MPKMYLRHLKQFATGDIYTLLLSVFIYSSEALITTVSSQPDHLRILFTDTNYVLDLSMVGNFLTILIYITILILSSLYQDHRIV